jgi:FkbM family methyltransferase
VLTAIGRRLWRTRIAFRARRLARAAAISRSALFLAAECAAAVRVYTLRSGATVVVRHRTRDVTLLVEVFGDDPAYEPPAAVAQALHGPLRVLDLGGNIGMFGAFALQRWPVAELVSIEPDPENAAVLRRVIALSGRADRWRSVEAAVSARSGRMRFLATRSPESRQAEPQEPGRDVEMIDLFGLGFDADLIKMDIEGGEWAILGDPRMSALGARVIVLEWHWRFAPDGDPRAAVIRLLGDAGYTVAGERREPQQPAVGVIWALRPGK